MAETRREVRATFDSKSITVYQAFSPAIANPAADLGRFSMGFKRDRMTWIKPSFLWMMYRSGWAQKSGQERVLAISVSRSGFEWALKNSSFSHFDPKHHLDRVQWHETLSAPVRIQWDPERDIGLNKMETRSLQVGLSGDAVNRYCDEWIIDIKDVTPIVNEMHRLVRDQRYSEASLLLPTTRAYPFEENLAHHIGM